MTINPTTGSESSLMSNHTFWIGALVSLAPVATAPAQETPETLQQRVERLERMVAELSQQLKNSDRKAEVKTEETAAIVRKTSVVGADIAGFTIKSADQNFTLRIGADLQIDNRSLSGQGSNANVDSTLLRRVRPTFSGTVYKYVDYFFRPDFGQGSTIIYDAYLELKYYPWANVRVGKFKLPVLENRVSYAVGVFNGVPDNGLSDASASNHRDYAGRVFLTPFSGLGESPLSGLEFGVGASGGNVVGQALPAHRTVGQNALMTFTPGVAHAGHRTRVSPGAYCYRDPFGLFGECAVSEEGLQKGTVRHDLGFQAWQVQASNILSGERKSFVSPTPSRPAKPVNGSAASIDTSTAWCASRLITAMSIHRRNRTSERVLLTRFQINFI